MFGKAMYLDLTYKCVLAMYRKMVDINIMCAGGLIVKGPLM